MCPPETPEAAPYRSDSILGYIPPMTSPERRARLREIATNAWRSPAKRAGMLAGQRRAMSSPGVRARVSAGVTKSWADPDVRARRCAANKKAAADPELRSRRTVALRKTLASPAARSRKSAAMKKVWAQLKTRAGRLILCDAHLERTGERVPAFHVVGSAFCSSCFRGEPLRVPTRGRKSVADAAQLLDFLLRAPLRIPAPIARSFCPSDHGCPRMNLGSRR